MDLETRLAGIEETLRLQRLKLSPLLTLSEAARYLRISKPTIKKLVTDGLLEASVMPIGKRRYYRVSEAQLKEYLDSVRAEALLCQPEKKLIKVPDIKL